MTPTQEDVARSLRWRLAVTEELLKRSEKARIAAEERGARMALEAAAKVADENKWPDRMVDASWADGDTTPANHNQTCEEVATAIRQIDPAAIVRGHPDE